jgi:hypothetical protein
MNLSIEDDRLAHLLMGGDSNAGYDEARRRLDRASLILGADASAALPWAQAALLTVAECGVRMFPGGVYLAERFDQPTVVGQFRGWPLRRHLEIAGCRTNAVPEHAVALHVGTQPRGGRREFLCWADGWTAVASPNAPLDPPRSGNEIGGVLAGALGVSEIFRAAVLGDLRAGRRRSRLSAFSPANANVTPAELRYLPTAYWLLGLGNLGQAALWTIGMLPYADPSAVSLFIQDIDSSEAGNLPIQILTKPHWIGRKKARSTAEWADDVGFRTTIVERRFVAGSRRSDDEPGIALVGVDNLPTRRAAALSNFDLVLDAGLGATAPEIFDIRLHAFPGVRSPARAWPESRPEAERPLDRALQDLVDAGRIDKCGALTIAGRSLGVPSTAVAAAAVQVAQACRAVSDGSYCDFIDVGLVDCRRIRATTAALARSGALPFVEVSDIQGGEL